MDLSNLDTSNITDMSYMFGNCLKLTSLDLSGFDTSRVIDMSHMFDDCTSLQSLNISGWDTSRVTDMSDMFNMCSSLTSLGLSTFDTSRVTNMFGMFDGCGSLTSLDLSGFDTSKVTEMSYMFHHCGSLASLDLSTFDTSRVTGMGYMFYYCQSLKSINLSRFDTSKVTHMGAMFYYCQSLKSLDLSSFDTSRVAYMHEMFYDCESLETIRATDKFNTRPVEKDSNMFYRCFSLRGGNGTRYSASCINSVYARIDTSDQPGYFTQGGNATSAKPKPISIARASVSVKSKTYTGKALKPSSVTVKVGGKRLVSGRDYTVSCKGGKAVGSYKVTIKGKGNYTGTRTATFKILPKGTSVSKVKAAKRGFTVTWKKPPKANLKQTTGYKVQWSTDKKFKKAVKSKLIKKSKTASLKVSKLKGGKKYYVRVCTYKKVGSKYYYSSWSKAKAVQTRK